VNSFSQKFIKTNLRKLPILELHQLKPLYRTTFDRQNLQIDHMKIYISSAQQIAIGIWLQIDGGISFVEPLTDKVCPVPPSWPVQSRSSTINAAYQVVRSTWRTPPGRIPPSWPAKRVAGLEIREQRGQSG